MHVWDVTRYQVARRRLRIIHMDGIPKKKTSSWGNLEQQVVTKPDSWANLQLDIMDEPLLTHDVISSTFGKDSILHEMSRRGYASFASTTCSSSSAIERYWRLEHLNLRGALPSPTRWPRKLLPPTNQGDRQRLARTPNAKGPHLRHAATRHQSIRASAA